MIFPLELYLKFKYKPSSSERRRELSKSERPKRSSKKEYATTREKRLRKSEKNKKEKQKLENYPDKKMVLTKLQKLDALMEELELDFTEVMVSESWDPIRTIVQDLTKEFSV